jgi:hypothetical protein
MRLGELRVESRELSPAQVQRALDHTNLWRCRLGEAAQALGLVTPERLLTYLSRQLQVPFLRREELLQQGVPGLLRCVPPSVLARLRVCPLRVEWQGSQGLLSVATSQPGNLHLLEEVAAATECTVRPVLALAEDIAFVLRHHGIEAEPPRALALEEAEAHAHLPVSRDFHAP